MFNTKITLTATKKRADNGWRFDWIHSNGLLITSSMTLAMLICQCPRTRCEALANANAVIFTSTLFIVVCLCLTMPLYRHRHRYRSQNPRTCRNGNKVSREKPRPQQHVHRHLCICVTIYRSLLHFNDLYASKHSSCNNTPIIIIIPLNVKINVKKKRLENSANATKFAVKCSEINFMRRIPLVHTS